MNNEEKTPGTSPVEMWTNAIDDATHDALYEILTDALSDAGTEFRFISDDLYPQYRKAIDEFKVAAILILAENQIGIATKNEKYL